MGSGTRLVNRGQVVLAIAPQNATGTALTSAWLSLKNYNHVTLLIGCGAWAGGTSAVTINQAQDASGTGSKQLTGTLGTAFQWTNGTNTALDTLIETAVASDTFNLAAASEVHVLEIDADNLDRNNNFDFIQLSLGSPGANNDFVCAFAFLGATPRYSGKPDNLPSALS